MYMAYVHSQAQFREQRVLDLEVLGNVIDQDIRPYLSYLPGLEGLLALLGTYIEEWVREFYALVWVAPNHSSIHYALASTDYRVTAERARETWGLTAYDTKIYELCYAGYKPPRHPHGGELSPVNFISPCFCQPFSKGSRCSVGGLTRPARIMDFVMRKTLLLRPGYCDGFTRIQQWLIAHLVAQREFDI
jgi:hypothetical protein